MGKQGKSTYPGYTEFEVYTELAALAAKAGIPIEYVNKSEVDDGVIGFARGTEYTPHITMMKDHDYGIDEYAAFVLAHELAHTLVDPFYSEGSHHFYRDNPHIRQFIEADADKIGAALYSLAEMTVAYKAESIWRDEEATERDKEG